MIDEKVNKYFLQISTNRTETNLQNLLQRALETLTIFRKTNYKDKFGSLRNNMNVNLHFHIDYFPEKLRKVCEK